jgi:glucuronoarabinoxylan endo-1,4-beta-xylanase
MRTHPKLALTAAALAFAALSAVETRAVTAVIDTNITHQKIRGFGGATVFQPPGLPASLSDSEMDTLFGNGPGQIGFTILRIRVAPDDAWRAIELSHAQRARARGAIVMASPWSPPASMKSNNSLIDGFLNPSSYTAYATYLNDFAKSMAANGAPLFAVSVQNEPDIDVDYESCVWSPQQMLDFVRNHAGAITATRLVAPESFQFRKNISDPILNDAVANENFEIVGGHIYGGGLADYPLARAKDKEAWMTEHLVLETDWTSVLATGREIHECLATANFNAYIWWYLRRYYGPLGEDGVVTKRGHVMSQFAKFIRPGFVRVGATGNPTTGVYVSAYRKDKLVIVAINQGASPVDQIFSVSGASVASVTPWRTSSTLDMAQQPSIAVAANSFTATLPASSITTFVGDLIFAGPAIVVPPPSRTVARGATLVLDVTATGEVPSFQWNRNGVPIPGATSRLLTLEAAQPADAGNYTVTVTNSGGSVTSAGATVAVVDTATPGRLVNISTRSPVGTGFNVQIAGFVIGGSAPKQVLVRAAGPALAGVVDNVLVDPIIELHDQDAGTIIATNNNWDSALLPTFSAVGAFVSLQGAVGWVDGSKDAALLVTLDPGPYTALVRGADGGTGNAIVEVYEVAGTPTGPKLVNISTRSLVEAGLDVQIGGFVIAGHTAKSVVIRATGPELNDSFALNGVLADPVIELTVQSTGEVITSNDDWGAEAASLFGSVGAFAWTPESRDAAIVTSLEPGGYTVIVRGKNGGTGMALVEIYEKP